MMKIKRLLIKQLLLAILMISVSAILDNCSTIAPSPVHATEISFDGNHQDSGIIGPWVDDKGFPVSQFWLNRYNDRIKRHGQSFSPPVITNFGILFVAKRIYANKQAMLYDLDMAGMK